MTTRISDVPKDLIEQILSRVPLKSVRAVKSTCKNWNSLYKSESFTKNRIDKAAAATREDESMMIVVMNRTLYLSSVVINDVDPSTEIKGKLTCLNEQVYISQVYYCEGLLLLLCHFENSSRLVVWNPYWGQTRSIEPGYSHESRAEIVNYMYALGYVNKMNSSCRSHKVLRFRCLDDLGSDYYYEIYDLDSDLLKTLDVTPLPLIDSSRPGVSLKGNTYWCNREMSSTGEIVNHLISFDFTTEKFGPLLPMPFCTYEGDHSYVNLAVVREEKLAVLCHSRRYGEGVIDLWITTKIEAEKVSWSKFLRVDLLRFTSIDGSFFIDEEKKLAVGFDFRFHIIGEAGYHRELDFGGPDQHQIRWPYVCSYVPSLVQINRKQK